VRKLIIIFPLLFFTFSLLWAEPVEKEIRTGRELYFEAVKNGEKTDTALAYYEDLHSRYPDNPFVKVFLGCVYILKARDTSSPLSKMKWVRKANKQFDTAVKSRPDNIFLRLERGENSLYLPSFLGRFKVAEEDFTFVVQKMSRMSDEEIYTMEGASIYIRPTDTEQTYALRMRQFALFYAGLVASEKKEKELAEKYWQSLIALGPDTKTARTAHERIEKLHESK